MLIYKFQSNFCSKEVLMGYYLFEMLYELSLSLVGNKTLKCAFYIKKINPA